MSSDFDPDESIQDRLSAILFSIYRENRFYGPTLVLHISYVAVFAAVAATELGGDGRLAYLAGLLHDIGAAMKGPKDHHQTGAEIAGKMLRGLGYPKETIEQVKQCLLVHRGSIASERITIEARCVASADGFVHFFRVADLFWVAFVKLGLDASDAGEWVGKKLQRSWNKMLPQHRAMVASQGRAGMKENLALALDQWDKDFPPITGEIGSLYIRACER